MKLVGRVLDDNSWQNKSAQAFDLSCFEIDWQQEQTTCPLGQTSRNWRCFQDDSDNQVVEVRFHQAICAQCEQRHHCTKTAKAPCVLKLRPMAQHQALQAARQNQQL
ncbi:transposase [Pleurocapsa sp. PCC 7319]|uniref:transposase n=1 Tax=Pleurocapsa sp. PCC 7319 TaxID=118161 RepID=UPI000344C4CC|nr:transposase [Pleurocapsa sp. PCC 7319]